MSNQTTPPIPPDAVPVVPATQNHLNKKVIANIVETVGMAILALQYALPDLQHIFPHALWLGPAVTAIGKIWTSIQQQLDKKNIQPVNYTPQG